METIQKKINDCTLCGRLPKLTNSIQLGRVPLVIIGESPANDGWIESGRAFYNVNGNLQSSGKILDKLLSLLGLKIEDVYFTECCKCLIGDRKNFDTCSKHCKGFLFEQLSKIDCKIILTMGQYPTQVLLNRKITPYSSVVGQIFNLKIMRYT